MACGNDNNLAGLRRGRNEELKGYALKGYALWVMRNGLRVMS